MPDILIRGMEMPTGCMYCYFYSDFYGACKLTKTEYPDWFNVAVRATDCPLHELPPHGDLISKDASINAILGEPPEAHYPSWYASIVNEILAIVPADKEESE